MIRSDAEVATADALERIMGDEPDWSDMGADAQARYLASRGVLAPADIAKGESL